MRRLLDRQGAVALLAGALTFLRPGLATVHGQEAAPGAVTTPTPANPAAASAGTTEAEVPGSAVSSSAGFNIATSYYFRGIPQQTKNLMYQPYTNLSFQIVEPSDDMPVGLSFDVSTWNSIHGADAGNPWYESDFLIGATLSLPGHLSLGFLYGYIYGPSLGDIFDEELDFSLAHDDSSLWGESGFSLGPTVILVIETNGGADGLGPRGKQGSYLELKLTPAYSVMVSKRCSVDLSLPVRLGLNLGDYYETSGPHNDDTLGFFEAGISAGMPLSFIPVRYGKWSASLAGYAIVLSDSNQEIGERDFSIKSNFHDVEYYALLRASVEF